MRKLVKGPKPAVLVQNDQQWTNDLLAVLAQQQKPTQAMKDRYRHPEIKNALILETTEKCAYCESKVRHIVHGDIEHIVPKSKVPAKAYRWDNLTLACDICNGNKGDYYSDDPATSQDSLVDPYVDDPKEHFLFMREIVTPRPDSLRALATEKVIKFARGQLLERRRERMDFLDGLVRAYSLAALEHKQMLLNDLREKHLKESDEYYASSIEYFLHLQSKGVIQ